MVWGTPNLLFNNFPPESACLERVKVIFELAARLISSKVVPLEGKNSTEPVRGALSDSEVSVRIMLFNSINLMISLTFHFTMTKQSVVQRKNFTDIMRTTL